jgi:hypothetical protein
MDYGVPLGRRFRALKLWFTMRYFGREGLANMLREHVRLAQELVREIDADPRFERIAPAPFSVVCWGRACGPWNFMKNPDGWADPLVRPRGVGLRPAMPAFLRASASREDAARNGGMASRRLAPQTRTGARAGFSTLPAL